MKKIALLILLAATFVGCTRHWDEPATLELTDGSKLECIKGIKMRPLSYLVECRTEPYMILVEFSAIKNMSRKK